MVKYLLPCVCRRILVMEWVTGVKLTTLPQAELRALVAAGQQSFLTQLLEVCAHEAVPSSAQSALRNLHVTSQAQPDIRDITVTIRWPLCYLLTNYVELTMHCNAAVAEHC